MVCTLGSCAAQQQSTPTPSTAPAKSAATDAAEVSPPEQEPERRAAAAATPSNLGEIWAVDDGSKVKATDLRHRLKRRNGIFNGQSVRLFGARNEIVAFQVILEGGRHATKDVEVTLPNVGTIKNGKLHASADGYFLGRRIELFLEHYLHVKSRSRDLAWDPNSAAMPRQMTGWIPDALIPITAARRRFDVLARRNQAVWVDLYIPKNTRAGRHRGTLQVSVGGKICRRRGCRLPIELEVLDATLPDTPTVKTMLYFSGSDDDRDQMVSRYLTDPWSADPQSVDRLRERHYKLGRRHRVTMFVGADKTPGYGLAQRVSGKTFSRAAGYEGPGEGIGQDLYSIHTYGGVLSPSQARQWHGWFGQHAPKTTFFLYVADEPSKSAFSRLDKIAVAAHPVPAFVTHDYTPALRNVDIFCALPSTFRADRAAEAVKRGKQLWIYNGVRPFSGSFVIDDVAISPRVNPWIQYKYRIARWFYWESTFYKDEQGTRRQTDVFSHPINYTNHDGDRMNGDGLLIYPGRDQLFPKQDRGLDLPLPSIRLKNWRRGIQDVEYLELARRRGHTAAIKRLLQQMVPRALAHQTRAGRKVSWPESGERWLSARKQLARLLK